MSNFSFASVADLKLLFKILILVISNLNLYLKLIISNIAAAHFQPLVTLKDSEHSFKKLFVQKK